MFKKFILPTLLSAIAMMLLAGLWHELIMVQFYIAETAATHEGTGVIFIAYLILAALMSYLYHRDTTDEKPLLKGIKFGVVIGLLWVFPHELAMAGAHGESLPYVFINATWHAVEQAAGGVVLALVYSRAQQS